MPQLPVGRDEFLAHIHADPQVQAALRRKDIAEVAVKIAAAAGFRVEVTDLANVINAESHSQADVLLERAGECIDFDGDGIPDVIRRDDYWAILNEDG